MENYICFAVLSTGSKIKLTEQDYQKFSEADNDDFIEVSGKVFKKSAVMEVADINDWQNEKSYNYGQAYTNVKALPALGYSGTITQAKQLSAIKAMATGLKKAKNKFNRPTPAIDNLLNLARQRYTTLKNATRVISENNT